MRFLSIYKHAERSSPPSLEEMTRMGKLIEEGIRAGYLLGVEGCMHSSAGARVRVDDGHVTVSDGPFTEAKEVVGGFALFKVDSKAEAVAHAREFLQFMGEGECELRQLYDPPTSSQP